MSYQKQIEAMSQALTTLESLAEFARQAAPPEQPGNWAAEHTDVLNWINTSKFDFAQSLAVAYNQYGRLTPRQVAATRKCMAYEAVTKRSQEVGPDLMSLPPGMYAVPSGTTRLKVKIAKPGEGSKWHGWVFVSDAAEYGQGRRYGVQRPDDALYTGQIVEEMRIIAADPAAASAAYGRLTGRCGVCGRLLENADSVARGIGPICADKMGW